MHLFKAGHSLSLVAAGGSYSLVVVPGLHCSGFSCCGARALGWVGSVVRHTGLVAQRYIESSPTRDWTRVPGIGRQSLNHWITREVPDTILSPSHRLIHLILLVAWWSMYPYHFHIADKETEMEALLVYVTCPRSCHWSLGELDLSSRQPGSVNAQWCWHQLPSQWHQCERRDGMGKEARRS